ncbi:MAG: GvpL/GvpF family gas vesicle protein [Hormoscilla sp. GUM202]|nr:GvpL/GvpF family gas vesicle protein [Hormoscilla sp. GUM202]
MTYGIYLSIWIFLPPGPVGLELQGLDKQPVYTQEVDGLIFLYSEALQEKYLASRRNLLGHEKVLELAMQAGYRTLLPLRFGLIVRDWETVKRQLTMLQGQGLQRLFAKLEGRREVGIKIFWDPDAELQLLLAENRQLRAKRDGLLGKVISVDETIAIGQALEREMRSRQEGIIEVFERTLNPLAVEVVENDTLMEKMIYNAAYLIPWDDEEKFSEEVEALDQKFDGRLRIRYNNFTAPFNFAQLE